MFTALMHRLTVVCGLMKKLNPLPYFRRYGLLKNSSSLSKPAPSSSSSSSRSSGSSVGSSFSPMVTQTSSTHAPIESNTAQPTDPKTSNTASEVQTVSSKVSDNHRGQLRSLLGESVFILLVPSGMKSDEEEELVNYVSETLGLAPHRIIPDRGLLEGSENLKVSGFGIDGLTARLQIPIKR